MRKHRVISTSGDHGISHRALAALLLSLILSSGAMVAALQSPGLGWLGWLTLTPLLLSIRLLSPVRAALAGSFWGVCFFALVAWKGGALFDPSFSAFSLLALAPGLYAGLGSRITRRIGFSPLMLGLGWVGVELALKPLAMRHGLLAATQGDGALVSLVGNVAGYVLVAFLVAYVSASLISVFHAFIRGSANRQLLRCGSVRPEILFDQLLCDLQQLLQPSRPRGPPVLV